MRLCLLLSLLLPFLSSVTPCPKYIHYTDPTYGTSNSGHASCDNNEICRTYFDLDRNQDGTFLGVFQSSCSYGGPGTDCTVHIKKSDFSAKAKVECSCTENCIDYNSAMRMLEEMKQELLKVQFKESRKCLQFSLSEGKLYSGPERSDVVPTSCSGNEQCYLVISTHRSELGQLTNDILSECRYPQKEYTCNFDVKEDNEVYGTIECVCKTDNCFSIENALEKKAEMEKLIAKIPHKIGCPKFTYVAKGTKLEELSVQDIVCEKGEVCQMELAYFKNTQENTEGGGVITECNGETKPKKDGCESLEAKLNGVPARTATCYCSTSQCIERKHIERKWKQLVAGNVTAEFNELEKKKEQKMEETKGSDGTPTSLFSILLLVVIAVNR